MSTSDAVASTRRFATGVERCQRERAATRSASCRLFAVGDVVARRYVLESVLAAGSMGLVWVARDAQTARSVAIKLSLHLDEMGDAVPRGELLFEARLGACVKHPAIVETLDAGTTEEGESFVVFELLEGEDLRARLEREGRLPAADAVALLLPILNALGRLHAQGVVHRDVKPANIFLSQRGDGVIQPKLIDFGIARSVTQPSPGEADFTLGSPSYMSPELAHCGARIDARADLWAATVVLYESIAGIPPWHALTWPSLVKSISASPAQSLANLDLVDEALWRIIARGLEKDLASRWQTADELAAELTGWYSSQPTVQLRRAARRRGRPSRSGWSATTRTPRMYEART